MELLQPSLNIFQIFPNKTAELIKTKPYWKRSGEHALGFWHWYLILDKADEAYSSVKMKTLQNWPATEQA